MPTTLPAEKEFDRLRSLDRLSSGCFTVSLPCFDSGFDVWRRLPDEVLALPEPTDSAAALLPVVARRESRGEDGSDPLALLILETAWEERRRRLAC